MSRFLVAILGMTVVGTTQAGWEGALEPSLYYSKFDSYKPGEALSDKGVKSGSWGSWSQHALAAASTNTVVKAMVMDVTTDANNLKFAVTSGQVGLTGPKAVHAVVRPGGLDKLPVLDADKTKAALCVYAPAGQSATFQGWGVPTGADSAGWMPLSSDKVTASTNAWYDVSIWVVKKFDDKIHVQYRVKVGDTYEPLYDSTGNAWPVSGVANGDAVVRSVGVRGHGSFERVVGKELPGPGVNVGFRP